MAVAVAVAVSGGVAVAVPVAGLTKRFFNHPKIFLNQCLVLPGIQSHVKSIQNCQKKCQK